MAKVEVIFFRRGRKPIGKPIRLFDGTTLPLGRRIWIDGIDAHRLCQHHDLSCIELRTNNISVRPLWPQPSRLR